MSILTWTEYLAATDADKWLFDYREDPEQISDGDAEDAVDSALEDEHPDVPDEVTIYAFQYCTKPDEEEVADYTLEHLLSWLDEEYGDPDGDAAVPTPAMMETMRIAVRTTLASYNVWRCEPVADIVVRREDLPLLWAEFDEAASKGVEK